MCCPSVGQIVKTALAENWIIIDVAFFK